MADPPAGALSVTSQIGSLRSWRHAGLVEEPVELRDAAQLLVVNAAGQGIPFGAVYREQKTIVVFVRHFLCYACKEYVEDLGKIPKKLLQDANVRLVVIGQSSHHHIKPFCTLTGYPHEMYVDPEREIYRTLGMKRGEAATSSGNEIHFVHLDKNKLDHAHINTVLQLAGVQTVNFTNRSQIIDV
ncbi:peroxiredoxin-like 2C isoform X1 [Rhineura floridana]|uniref:peroxiredoxin-like 2C isoform X1 n=1 Tax=Rhineura floridana TaxID=261503 RepID=UPI002AC86C36|nr:peroxiredoxin-like 2C isoform X1 [Rhineura floridana]